MPNIGPLEEAMKGGCTNFCNEGKCSGCGECCSAYLPVSKEEIEKIKRYVKRNHIKKHEFPPYMSKFAMDLTCPFLDFSKSKDRCMIYPVRPLICRDFTCNKDPKDMSKELLHAKLNIVNMQEIDFWK